MTKSQLLVILKWAPVLLVGCGFAGPPVLNLRVGPVGILPPHFPRQKFSAAWCLQPRWDSHQILLCQTSRRTSSSRSFTCGQRVSSTCGGGCGSSTFGLCVGSRVKCRQCCFTVVCAPAGFDALHHMVGNPGEFLEFLVHDPGCLLLPRAQSE